MSTGAGERTQAVAVGVIAVAALLSPRFAFAQGQSTTASASAAVSTPTSPPAAGTTTAAPATPTAPTAASPSDHAPATDEDLAHLDLSGTADDVDARTKETDWDVPPEPRPRKPGVVAEAAIGALGFTGQFKHVAPPAPWLHVQVGYEPLSWLMIFGEGELAYTETSDAVDETRQRAFPIFGFGGGVRATWHVTPRVGLYAQGAVDLLEADVTKNELGLLGFEGMEKLKPAFGGRIGAVWYQRDRHLAFVASFGLRDATGFAPSNGVSDTPLLWDGSLAIAYTF